MSEPRLPTGVSRRTFDGEETLATRGEALYGEAVDDRWREWAPRRSKLAAMYELGLDPGLTAGDAVLYLGAAAGTTVSHVADVAGPVYAVEFAPRPARDLLGVATARPNVIPLLKDARRPETYTHVVESGIDVLVQDVATRGQARVASRNAPFLADDGRLVLAVKARSEDVTRDPEAVYAEVERDLETEYDLLESVSLSPYHAAHRAVIARPR